MLWAKALQGARGIDDTTHNIVLVGFIAKWEIQVWGRVSYPVSWIRVQWDQLCAPKNCRRRTRGGESSRMNQGRDGFWALLWIKLGDQRRNLSFESKGFRHFAIVDTLFWLDAEHLPFWFRCGYSSKHCLQRGPGESTIGWVTSVFALHNRWSQPKDSFA